MIQRWLGVLAVLVSLAPGWATAQDNPAYQSAYERGDQAFKESRFEMGANLSAVAAAEGKAKTAKYNEGVMVFTRPLKGLMAEASIGGQKFSFVPLAP